MPSKIGLVGLGEAGNLGDDLILVAVAQAVGSACPDAEIRYTGFGRPLDWADIARLLKLRTRPTSVPADRDLPGSRRAEAAFADRHAIIFGGGGLFETSHHPHRPYHWLRFLPGRRPRVPVLGVGLGLGPLSARWQRTLRAMGLPFDACYLRDDDSVEYASTRLAWNASRCKDFVDRAFLGQFSVPVDRERPNDDGERIAGVALRHWPGLTVDAAAQHIDQVARAWDVDEVRLFVLEATEGRGPDLPFCSAVMRKLATSRTTLRPYAGPELVDFVQDLARCSVAVSMKLHANAIWAATGVPMYPIFYAPKTAAFFGRPFRGLEIVNQVLAAAPDEPSVARAQDVTVRWLDRALAGHEGGRRSALTPRQRLTFQTASFAVNVHRRLRPNVPQIWSGSDVHEPNEPASTH
jgi:polysaccharide pyruvyl transferase WcaK-like protein